jgi:putative transposase
MKNRKSNRLKNYDYSQNGIYFVTICTKNRDEFFGEIKNGKIILNELGITAEKYLLEIPKHFSNSILDKFIVMPNHIHLIVEICDDDDDVGTADLRSLPIRSLPIRSIPTNRTKMLLSKIIHGFKSSITREINKKNPNIFQWQRSFYDHVIRNETSLNKIREYIIKNPEMWERDKNNTENILM